MRLKTLLISSILLAGCASKPPELPPDPVVVTEYIYPDCGTVPPRNPVSLRLLDWQVVDGLFTLTPAEYENLSYNISEITRGVQQLLVQLEYYEQCLSGFKKSPSGKTP